MTLEERIKNCMTRHADWDDRHISRSTRGSTLAMVRLVREGKPPDVAPVQAEAGVITLDSVRARYDIAAAIRREIGRLRPGALILESEMRARSAGKDASRFRRAIENTEEFKANRIKLQLDPEGGEGAYYWGDASTIAAAAKVRDSI